MRVDEWGSGRVRGSQRDFSPRALLAHECHPGGDVALGCLHGGGGGGLAISSLDQLWENSICNTMIRVEWGCTYRDDFIMRRRFRLQRALCLRRQPQELWRLEEPWDLEIRHHLRQEEIGQRTRSSAGIFMTRGGHVGRRRDIRGAMMAPWFPDGDELRPETVVQVLAHGEILDERQTVRGDVCRGAHAGQEEDFGGVERAGG